jgi:hypothetical protein
MPPPIPDERLIEAVARCLAKERTQAFISATLWAGTAGEKYRQEARAVLETIRRFETGARSGGLPACRR